MQSFFGSIHLFVFFFHLLWSIGRSLREEERESLSHTRKVARKFHQMSTHLCKYLAPLAHTDTVAHRHSTWHLVWYYFIHSHKHTCILSQSPESLWWSIAAVREVTGDLQWKVERWKDWVEGNIQMIFHAHMYLSGDTTLLSWTIVQSDVTSQPAYFATHQRVHVNRASCGRCVQFSLSLTQRESEWYILLLEAMRCARYVARKGRQIKSKERELNSRDLCVLCILWIGGIFGQVTHCHSKWPVFVRWTRWTRSFVHAYWYCSDPRGQCLCLFTSPSKRVNMKCEKNQ